MRLPFAASAAINYARMEPRMLREGASDELWEQRRPAVDLLHRLADEARRLASAS